MLTSSRRGRGFSMRFNACIALPCLLVLAPASGCSHPVPNWPGEMPPNVVIVLADDMGWGDVGPFDGEHPTPHLDRMASEGRVFTDFYVTSPGCSASRAGLLTGCYSRRISIPGALGGLGDRRGLNPDEVTLAEICKQRGYRTAIFGKWHLGSAPNLLPPSQGFDEYFGIPFSHDIHWDQPRRDGTPCCGLPLIEEREVVDEDLDAAEQEHMTARITERAVAFIRENRERPFFLYLSQLLPHVPLRVPEEMRGRASRLYGDAVALVDDSVGAVLETLREEGLEDRTFVIFLSDNGPWLRYGTHAGSAGPLREGKGTTFDGGVRSPTVMWWPGTIPAGTTSSTPAMTIDLLPTLAAGIGARLPSHRIDGKDIWPMIVGEPGAESPQEAYFFYGSDLEAIRSGRWKMHFPHIYLTCGDRPPATDGRSTRYDKAHIEMSLFDLENDPEERVNVLAEHPEVVTRIQGYYEAMRGDVGVEFRQRGPGCRPHGLATRRP